MQSIINLTALAFWMLPAYSPNTPHYRTHSAWSTRDASQVGRVSLKGMLGFKCFVVADFSKQFVSSGKKCNKKGLQIGGKDTEHNIVQ